MNKPKSKYILGCFVQNELHKKQLFLITFCETISLWPPNFYYTFLEIFRCISWRWGPFPIKQGHFWNWHNEANILWHVQCHYIGRIKKYMLKQEIILQTFSQTFRGVFYRHHWKHLWIPGAFDVRCQPPTQHYLH